MDQIEALQGRLVAAMERIGSGASAIAAAADDAAQADAQLKQALDEEKLANAQLQERLRTIKEKHASDLAAAGNRAGASEELATLRKEVAAQSELLAELDRSLQALRTANDHLRKANAALRDANAEGVGDPALINAGLQAELDAANAARQADHAETAAVLARIEPLITAAVGERM
jgi:chromosome segregation ATPase